MRNAYFIGLAAGLASALLYLSISTGAALAMLLFYIAPLPLFIAGFGWGVLAALIGGGVGAGATAIAVGPALGVVFVATIAAPVAFLTQLALLARPVDADDPNSVLEWYPEGRLLLWSAAIGTVMVAGLVLALGGSVTGFKTLIMDALREGLTGDAPALQLPENVDIEALISGVASFVGPVAAALWTLTTVVNMWLAGRVATASGLTARPMPDLALVELPRPVLILTAAAVLLTFMPGLIGYFGWLAVATLSIVYFLVGLATIHLLTRGMAMRGLILFGVYLFTLVFIWVAVLIIILGFADAGFDLRRRAAGKTPPPAPPSGRSPHDTE
ncbi:MAG: DUF2232 domain-containing protein [Pseudomonadota bacterium]